MENVQAVQSMREFEMNGKTLVCKTLSLLLPLKAFSPNSVAFFVFSGTASSCIFKISDSETLAKRELVIITSYPTRANGIIVLVNSQTGFCRRFLFPQFYKASGKRKLGALFSI